MVRGLRLLSRWTAELEPLRRDLDHFHRGSHGLQASPDCLAAIGRLIRAVVTTSPVRFADRS